MHRALRASVESLGEVPAVRHRHAFHSAGLSRVAKRCASGVLWGVIPSSPSMVAEMM